MAVGGCIKRIRWDILYELPRVVEARYEAHAQGCRLVGVEPKEYSHIRSRGKFWTRVGGCSAWDNISACWRIQQWCWVLWHSGEVWPGHTIIWGLFKSKHRMTLHILNNIIRIWSFFPAGGPKNFSRGCCIARWLCQLRGIVESRPLYSLP